MTAKRTRKTNLFFNEQSGDVYQDPASTDIVSRLSAGFVAQATPEVVARDNYKNSFTPDADLVALKTATMTGQSELYGADYSDGTTKPWFNALFRSAQLEETQVWSIPVSAIASGFVHGETVTGATGVGRVVVPTESTDRKIYIVVSTGGFGAETITGSIAGSATATGVEIKAGWSYKYNTDLCTHLSCRSEEDDQLSKMYNSVPTLTISADDSGIPYVNYEVAGVIYIDNDVPQWLRDGSMTAVTRDTQTPPLFQCGKVKYDDFSPVVDSTLTIDPQIERPARRDANNCGGVAGYNVTGRATTLTTRIDTPTNTDADVMLDWFNSADVAFEGRFGKDEENTFWFFAPTAKLENVAKADQDGYSKLDLTFKLTGQDDEEFEFVCI